MPSYPDFYVYGLVDGNGDIHRAVVNHPSDTMYISARLPIDHAQDPNGHVLFESEARHLHEWARDNGMATFKHGYKYNQLGDPLKAY